MRYCISCKTTPKLDDEKYVTYGFCDGCCSEIIKKIDEERLIQSILITAAEPKKKKKRKRKKKTDKPKPYPDYDDPHWTEGIEERRMTYPEERPSKDPVHLAPGYENRMRMKEEIPGRRKRLLAIDELVRSAEMMDSWKDWYERNDGIIEELFGADTDLLKSLLALTSPNNAVKPNVTQAMKAYVKILKGEPIKPGDQDRPGSDFLPNHAININKMLKGEPISGPKVIPFEKNVFGDRLAVTIDLHMQQLFYGEWGTCPKCKGAGRGKVDGRMQKCKTCKGDKEGYFLGKSVINADHTMFYADKIVREVAEELGWAPSETQAALWAFNLELRNEEVQSYDGVLERRSEEYGEIIRTLQEEYGTLFERSGREPGLDESTSGSDPDKIELSTERRPLLEETEGESEQGQSGQRFETYPINLTKFDPLNPEEEDSEDFDPLKLK